MFKVVVSIPFQPNKTYTVNRDTAGSNMVAYIRRLAKTFTSATKIAITTMDDIPVTTYRYNTLRGYSVFTTHSLKAVM
jgi:hypothetical protein